LVLAQILLDCLPMLEQEGSIVPRSFTDEGLHRPHGGWVSADQSQHEGLNRLAWQLRQHPLKIGVRRFPLFTPLKQGTVERMVVAQRLDQGLNILDHQLHLGCGRDQVHYAALLPRMADEQHYTTCRILVVVLGGDGICFLAWRASSPKASALFAVRVNRVTSVLE